MALREGLGVYGSKGLGVRGSSSNSNSYPAGGRNG